LLCSEVPVLSSNVLELACGWVDDLHIAGKILVSINLGEVAESLVGDFGNVKLMVADGQQIVVNTFEDGIGDIAVGGRRVAKSGAIMQVLLPGY
jgi:hypothetical protein